MHRPEHHRPSPRSRVGPLLLAGLFALGPFALSAQDSLELSLEEAVGLARSNNPSFRAIENDAGLADWDVRTAYGSLLPQATFGSGVTWQGSGDQNFGNLTASELGFADLPDFWTSNFSLTLGLQLNGERIYAPARAKAARARVQTRIRAAGDTLAQRVATAYLEMLRQAEEVQLAEQQLERARFNLRLAEVQREVGQVTAVDVQQAGVQVGRSEVTLLQAEQARTTARLRLLQILGQPIDRELRLTSTFELVEPRLDRAWLVATAVSQSPELQARRRSRLESDYHVKVSRSRYFPSLSISTGIGGFAREATSTDFEVQQAEAQAASRLAACEEDNAIRTRLVDPLPTIDCSQFAFTDAERRRIIEANDVFPFDFTRSSPSVSMSLSLPIFQGLSRQREVESAQLERLDADHRISATEMALEVNIAIELGAVQTAYRSALIEEANQSLADEQLRLAREQYTVGLIPFLELVEAETVKAEADRARIAAVFAYHDAITNLELTVGVPLRNITTSGGRP